MAKFCPVYNKSVLYLDCLECDEKKCKKRRYKMIVIGIDQSYQNCGISIVGDGEILKIKNINLKKIKTNTEKRNHLRKKIKIMLESIQGRADDYICIIERIRLRSQGFLNINYIKGIGALNSIIVDEMKEFGIKTYSVDTRAWKSQVIGTSKSEKNNKGVPEEKWPTVKWVIEKGYEKEIKREEKSKRKTKGVFQENGKKYYYDNDAADSVGIALFGFVGKKENLKEEF